MEYTSDLTGGKTYFGSSYYSNDYIHAKAFDDNEGTYWTVYGWDTNHYVGVNFGTAVVIRKLRILPVSNYLANFLFQGSNNGGQSWTTVSSGSAPAGQWYSFEFENETAYQYYRVLIPAMSNATVKEIEMMAEVEPEYKPSGTYISQPIPLDDLSVLRFFITKEEPTNTSATASYAINDDEATTPESWTEVENEDEVPMPEVTSGKFLWLKLLLETSDGEVTPSISAVWLEEATADTKKIQINLTPAGRIKYPQGEVTVIFTGSILGPENAAVAPFTESFTPTGIEPFFNPNDPEYIELFDVIAQAVSHPIDYVYAQSTPEYIELTDVTATAIRYHINDIPE